MSKTGPKKKPAIDRFWSMVEKQDGGCWLWGGPRFGNKYGQISLDDGGATTAHRFSWVAHSGVIPRGKFICHKCDVRNCVNPEHLYVGDHEDNMQDARERGRFALRKTGQQFKLVKRGELPRGRILTREQADRMRQEYAAKKYTQTQLAVRFGVSQGLVSKTVRAQVHVNAVVTGEKRKGHYRRKLPIDGAAQIVGLYRSGAFTQKALAAKFGVDQTYVSALVKRAS